MPEHLEQQIAINFTAPLMLARHALPFLIAREGMIINIGSAITCVPNSALGAYGATKAGLAYWNEALRRELSGIGRAMSAWSSPDRSGPSSRPRCSDSSPRASEANPVVESPRPWMTADVDEVARRVVRLIDQPRRRLSVRRRLRLAFPR